MAKKSKKQKNQGGIVYSTHPENIFADLLGDLKPTEKATQDFRIWLDRKGGNKVVSRVEGYQGDPQTLEKLKKDIQNSCGTGGTVKDREILIQGDHRDKILQLLVKKGYKAKKAGG